MERGERGTPKSQTDREAGGNAQILFIDYGAPDCYDTPSHPIGK